MSNIVTIHEYKPGVHSVHDLAIEQNEAVDFGEAQMLKWSHQNGELEFAHLHPFYIALLGNTAVGGAGFNVQYRQTNCVELGGAYVAKAAQGNGIYHQLTQARIEYVRKYGLQMITFANKLSAPILLTDFGFTFAKEEDVPPEAFELCGGCELNPQKPQPANLQTCCDRETILKLPQKPKEQM